MPCAHQFGLRKSSNSGEKVNDIYRRSAQTLRHEWVRDGFGALAMITALHPNRKAEPWGESQRWVLVGLLISQPMEQDEKRHHEQLVQKLMRPEIVIHNPVY